MLPSGWIPCGFPPAFCYFHLDIGVRLWYCCDMLKLSKTHTLYEVWSEWKAASVYVDHKPTTKEVDQIWKEQWPNTPERPKVFKEKQVYTAA